MRSFFSILTLVLVAAVCTACIGGSTSASGGTGGAVTDAAASDDSAAGLDAGEDTAAIADSTVDTDSSAAADAAGPAPDVAVAKDAVAGVDGAATDGSASCKVGELSDLFQKKIKPLVSKGQPTTCNQCHFSGVDLGLFVQESPCKSMACMQEKGMVDFGNPAASEVLTWIKKAKPESKLITTTIQDAEYTSFLEWIKWSASCQNSACGVIADPCGANAVPPPPPLTKPMLGACDEETLAAGFAAKVYKWRDRCTHCHAPYGTDANKAWDGYKAPLWLNQNKGVGGSKLTMYAVIGGPYINTASPVDSLLLTKPLAEKAGGVWHAGGDKFQNTKDQSYIDFLAWIKQYAACKGQ